MMRLVCLLTLTLRVGGSWKVAAVGRLHFDISIPCVVLPAMLLLYLNTLIGDRRYGDILAGRSGFRNRIVYCELLQQGRTNVGGVYCHHVDVVRSCRVDMGFVCILGVDCGWKR